ncbi:MAG: Fe(3+) ABC transporter substrate-binding protein [Alphaproteobacteria bacterium]|nr:Fe(3+) ABC transporter substrate-binding protein [Alphaproteobacteria bacterium]
MGIRLARRGVLGTVFAILLGGVGIGAALAADPEVNVYSFRQEQLIRPLLDAFTQKTGIQVNLVSGKDDALLERLKAEGANSPADLLMTVDAGRLRRAVEADLLQPVSSPTLEQLVPPQYREPTGLWYALSVRARPIMVAKERVEMGALNSYLDLAASNLKGKICVRSSGSVYNQSMLDAMIEHYGVAKTEEWVKGLVANLGRPPSGGDRDQIKAVAAGECDIAIANTYYLGQMVNSKDQSDREAAAKITVIWPDQDGFGVHVNVSGAGVTKSARNKEYAIKLIEYLASDEAQAIYASVVYEYPIRHGIAPASTLSAWGSFKADTLQVAKLGTHNAEAIRIADRAGWR